MTDQVGDGIVCDHAVCIDADVDILVGPLERKVQRVRLAAVWLGEHRQPARRDVRRVGVDGSVVGIVLRAVVDHDDANILVVRHHHRANGPHDDLLFVVCGDQYRDPRRIVRAGKVLPLPETVDDGEDSNDDQPRAHQNVAHEEDSDDQVVEESPHEEGDGIDARLPQLM